MVEFEHGSKVNGVSVPFTNTSKVPFITAVGMETLQKLVDPSFPVALNEMDIVLKVSIEIIG